MLFPVPRTTFISELVIELIIKFRRAKSEDTLQIMHRGILRDKNALASSDWSAGDVYAYERDQDECRQSYQQLAESFYQDFDLVGWAASLAAAHRKMELHRNRRMDFCVEKLVVGRDMSADWIVAAQVVSYSEQ